MTNKRTVLYDEHLRAGARIVDFAGWDMPVQYSGIIAEHEHTRKHVSLFDICHMGEFRITGSGAKEALDAIFARSVADQKPGVCRYNFLLNDTGKVADDLIVYCISETEYFIVVNAGTRQSDANIIKSRLPQGINFADESDDTAKIDLQGPESAKVLADCGLSIDSLPTYFKFRMATINGIDCLLSRTGYTGELGFEIYLKSDKAAQLWNFLLDHEAVKPAGLGARDTLRLEMGYALYGHELDDQTTPLEAGYAFMLKLKDNPDRRFYGSDALRSTPANKKLVGIKTAGRRAARAGCDILNTMGEKIGKVTSGAFGPSLGFAIAMGYIEKDKMPEDGKLLLDVGRTNLDGELCPLPFYAAGTARIKL